MSSPGIFHVHAVLVSVIVDAAAAAAHHERELK